MKLNISDKLFSSHICFVYKCWPSVPNGHTQMKPTNVCLFSGAKDNKKRATVQFCNNIVIDNIGLLLNSRLFYLPRNVCLCTGDAMSAQLFFITKQM